MTLIILLFAIGILFIAVEVIVPGGILGSIGALLMLGGCALAFREFGVGGGLLALLAGLVITGLALFIEFRILPGTKLGRRVFLTAQVTSVSAAVGTEAQALIGQAAEALTMLSPSGYVMVAGKRFEAFCESGQAPPGAALTIVGADNFRLIVTLNSTL